MRNRKFKKGESCFYIKKNVEFYFNKKITVLNPVHQLNIEKMVIKTVKKNGNYDIIGCGEYQEKDLKNYKELLIEIQKLI